MRAPGPRIRVAEGEIALTFDDGPEPPWTEAVLAALAEHGAGATFFVEAGRARRHPGTLAAIAAAGHEIGFHCVEHRSHQERAAAEVAVEAEEGLAVLAELGVRPRVWRTPYGDVSAASREVAATHGLALWGWTFDSRDWRGDASTEMLAALRGRGGLRGGEVILMHDSVGRGRRRSGCEGTVALTRCLLREAAGAGLRPVPLGDRAAGRSGTVGRRDPRAR